MIGDTHYCPQCRQWKCCDADNCVPGRITKLCVDCEKMLDEAYQLDMENKANQFADTEEE